MRTMLVMCLLLVAASMLFAQNAAPANGTAVVSTPKGIFTLRGGVLAKMNTASMKADKEMALFGAVQTPPAEGADNATRMAYYAELSKRNAPALLLVKDNSLLVIIGDGYARISQDTLTTEKAISIKDPNEPAADANQRGFRQDPVPGYVVVGDTLFLIRAREALSINTKDTAIITRAPLPASLQPAQNTPGRGPGGGGNRGN